MTDWVDITESGELKLTTDAPEKLQERMEKNPEEVKAITEFAIVMEAAGHDIDDWDIVNYRELSEYHLEKQDEAVEAGDIETAQEHQTFARQFKRIGEGYFAAIRTEGEQ